MSEPETPKPKPTRKRGPKPKSDLEPVLDIAKEYRAAQDDGMRGLIRALADTRALDARALAVVVGAACVLDGETRSLCLSMLDALDSEREPN